MKSSLFLASLSMAAVLGAGPAHAETRIAAIFDLTGGLNIYGIQQNNALNLAVESINAAGGVLGAPIKVVTYDAQSELSKYTQYANTVVLRDRVDVLFAGLTSSSREAIRPIARKANIPYFYSSLYEGGACDKQTFVTGASASQQLSVLIDWAVKKYGKKIYVMAPDYNFGTISARWIEHYARQSGAEVVGQDFLALTVTDYAPTIQKIQAARPDFVVALPVGANQTGFLEQFAAAGLKKTIGLVSTNYGSGNQQIVLSPDAGKGLIGNAEYFMAVDTPANAAFIKQWAAKYGNDTPVISAAVDVWNAVHLWANAVNKAGTAKTGPVIAALESGATFDAPNGPVKLEAGSHDLRQNIYIAEGDDKHGFKIVQVSKDVAPAYENEKCDLVAHPALAAHFSPDKQ
ncbi:ABC transporter substrate-binding protein [Bradyrhizobium sp. NAS80.1]|uniref:urea ABC transporter substrate-binding protein n=1 Tax=Bradyrhizobium sp. NAS80.1 TaxID=1680159 RepID=UPI00095E403B|nr:ABC transporter substrate-binding protein [Bradyrhizobium sp. NAS80.1]OKO76426.1 ABC transporter substrate-binding protein [Bradyrhizobium sp. NAS80.1]